MKRNLIGILSLVVMSVLISATGAYAQSYAKADVPFAFQGRIGATAGRHLRDQVRTTRARPRS